MYAPPGSRKAHASAHARRARVRRRRAPHDEQKWSKGKVKEKLQNLVLFDKNTYEKLLSDIPKNKLITPSIVSEKLKVNGSLARKAVKELIAKGLTRVVSHHHAQSIYTRSSH